MEITNCTTDDFEQILAGIADFWGSDRTLGVHHPMFVNEFGNSAYVIKDESGVVAYLFGFLSQTRPVGYVHLIGVRRSHQRRGLGHRLYERFEQFARANGCSEIKAITSPTNLQSIAFHRELGMELLGAPNESGVPVVGNYYGLSRDAVVFRKSLDSGREDH